MPVKHFRTFTLFLCLLLGSLLGCSVTAPSFGSQNTPTDSQPSQNQTQELNAWKQATPGIEVRFEHWKSPGDNEDTVAIARLDVHKVHLRIGYSPDKPEDANAWMKQTGALALMNGGYFDKNNQSTGLLISDGQVSGNSYDSFGGMLAVDMQGKVSLRSLHQQPYDAGSEQFQQATQSSPMLVIDGKRTQFQADSVSQRRSVVAMDSQGRLLFIASAGQAFTLDELADLLAASDLSIVTALNLDGGASTALHVDGSSGQQIGIDAFTPLPIVILVK